MKRIEIKERANWREQADEFGFQYHTMYGEPYWSEEAYYQFSLAEIEAIEDATNELHQMALKAVDLVVNNDDLLAKFAIPKRSWPFIRKSWERQDPSLYGRFDFAYDGVNPPKLLEYNADTPTSLFESAFFQWLWLDEQISNGQLPAESDQYNSIQEKMVERFMLLKEQYNIEYLHFTCCEDTEEDRGTVQYLQDCATEAGLNTYFLYIDEIGIGENLEFLDDYSTVIEAIFKLYPWEFMLREDFAEYLNGANALWLEPAWKTILSNKAILPLLWKMYPDHPNLLAAYFEGDRGAEQLTEYVCKPFFSREGANISIIKEGETVESVDGPYGEEGMIRQAFYPLPQFEGNYTLVGSWVIGEEACGLCIREDKDLITQDLSRFYPHAILPE